MGEEFDKIFKLTGDEDDRGTFWMITGIALPNHVRMKRLDREMVRPRMHVDDRFEVLEGEHRGIYIFEATTRFRREVYERCGRYGLEQVLECWKPVYPYFVVFTDKGPFRAANLGWGSFWRSPSEYRSNRSSAVAARCRGVAGGKSHPAVAVGGSP